MQLKVSAAILAGLLIAGCSGVTSSPPPPSALPQAASAPEPAAHDLCGLPGMAPAKLRTQPGYFEYSVSVVDPNGTAVADLRKQDFVATSGGKPVPIAYFRELGQANPVSMFVVGDASSSMYDKTVVRSGTTLDQVRDAIGEATAPMNACDEVGVVLVGGDYAGGVDPAQLGLPPSLGDVTLVQPFTTDHDLAMTKIYSVLPSGRDLLADGIKRAVNELAQANYPRRVLVVLTDGLDKQAIDDSVLVLQQTTNVDLWVIGIGDPNATTSRFSALVGTKRMDTAAVMRLADAGRGRVLFASPVASDQGASLAKAIRTIAVESRKGYAIGAVAPPHGPLPQVSLAKPATDIVRSEVVQLEVLARAATRPIQPPWECPEQAPKEVRDKPGYSEVAVSVTDKDGKPVRGLKQSELVVFSENQRYPVVYFNTETAPRSIVLAIDTSGSMTPKLGRVREETARLISGLSPSDRVALIAFSAKPFLLSGLTTDHQKVIDNLKLLHAYGQTAMYDALHTCLRLLSSTNECGRAILLVTDGMDNTSVRKEGTVLAEARRKHVAIYAIGIGNPQKHHFPDETFLMASEDEVDKAALDAMGKVGGGEAFIVPPVDSDQDNRFGQAMATVASRLRGGYKLGFIALPSAGPINVAVEGHDDYVVRISAPAPSVK